MMGPKRVVTTVDLEPEGFEKIASGKVREIFEIDPQTLLFVATDRISAYDVVLDNGIPDKGALLTQLSVHWFSLIRSEIPSLQIHLLSTELPDKLAGHAHHSLEKRSMQVRRYEIIPLESIVRGYITGSAWSEYKTKGTVHGMSMPAGLQESQKLETPMWTPSTKAEAGAHDENISPERAAEMVGTELAQKIEEASLRIYQMAQDHAEQRGIIIADTKFEFGIDRTTNEIVLVDEVLTPDSSRFWPADGYRVGRGQQSYDKQYLRDWLTSANLKGQAQVTMPDEVVQGTHGKYREAYEKLTGESWHPTS